MLHLFWRTANEPKRNHENGYTDCGSANANSAGVLHRRDPILKNDDDICVRTTSNNARVAIAVVKEIGELDTRQRDQPRRVKKGEQVAGPTEGDGEGSGNALDEWGFSLAGFRDASEDRREDGEEHDNNSDRSVDGVSQGATPQTDGRGVDNDDHGSTSYSTLEKKGEKRSSRHRPERSWRKCSIFRGRREGDLGESLLFLLKTRETNSITEHFHGAPT